MESPNYADLWNTVKGELEIVCNPMHFKTYIPGVYIKNIDTNDKIIEITALSDLQRNFLEDRMYGYLKRIIAKTIGSEYSLIFSITKKEASKIALDDLGPLFRQDVSSLTTGQMVQNRTDLSETGLNSQYTFDRFIVGNSNRLAYAVSTAIADSPGKVYNPFFLYSGVGMGKTHLVQAIGHEILKKHPNMTVLYKTGEQFLNEVVEALRKGRGGSDTKRSELKSRYRNTDVLIVDDIHSIAGKDTTQEEFFHTFNALHMGQKQIILTSDRAPHEIRTLEERLSSRFASGMIADIQPPDVETRLAILRDRNEEMKLQASDEVLEFIAGVSSANIRELEAKLLQTVTTAKSTGRDLNRDTAISILGEIDKNKPVHITPNVIMREVAKYYGVTLKELKGQRRVKTLVYPRQMCMYILKHTGKINLQAIGDLLGNRDHSTVIHGIGKVEKLSNNNVSITKELDQIKYAIINANE
ncbi:hypothetical protein A2982_03500 [candidate division WWE3 bacterium RIFCSPLOWO2_01_FULL_39_13]|uniref:Chromosomal replication initiator protein DnaA n=1 Tax=candidate division WWE3 bacterium RIFCSPLOWO2_01_FULL_39_13 TaxID=1802624 RepID=A0A1F4V3I2_UNCKA|nr:MAG: hypothetical protein A2982_03500 [candidate division WWE3 bacterium RIFCSPLOWO2_01_FULL_39_13]